ncbi:MAG: hypothetical protein WEB04_05025 [Dehalococcoidia bacterium]
MSSEKLATRPALPPRRFTVPSTSELLAEGRGRRALMGAAALFLFLLFILYVRPLGLLPGYPAVALALLAWGVVPGWLVQRALLRSDANVVERVAVAFLLSVAISAPAGIVGLRLHWTVEGFGVAYALLAAIAGGVSLLFPAGANDDEVSTQAGAPSFNTTPLLVLVAVPLLAIATSPWWSGNNIARDADDWVYMAYVNQYVQHDLDVTATDAGLGSYQRMGANVWVVDEALLVDSADVAPHELLVSFLPPLLTLLAAAGTFTLAKGVFGRTSVALLAVAFMLGYGILDLSPHEGFGRNLFLRIGEDKMVASFVLLPVGILLGWRFIVRPRVAACVAALTAGIALFAVHPLGLLFLGIAMASFIVCRTLVERWRTLVERSPLTLAAGLALALPLLALVGIAAAYLSEQSQTVVAVSETRLLFREEFHVQDVGHGLSIGSYHLLLHPLVLFALAVAPIVWLRARRDAGAQLLFAMAVAVPALFFIPPLTTALGKWFSWSSVWRLPWMLPTPLILALFCEQTVAWLARDRLRALALPATVVVVLAAALVVQEYYFVRDGGSFYNRTSSTALLPGIDSSITLGGLDRAFSSDWRLPNRIERLANYLEETAAPGSTVMAEGDVSVFLPGLLADINTYGGLNSATQDEVETAQAFYGAMFDNARDAKRLALAAGIDYLVVANNTPASDKMQTIEAYYYDRLIPRVGSPELGTFGIPNVIPGWALDANSEERIAARRGFVVPADISTEDLSLDFSLILAPLKPVEKDANARLVVAYFPPPPPGEELKIVNVVFEAELEKGLGVGTVVRADRSPSATVTPGAEYALVVARLGAALEDTYPGDIALFGLLVHYHPQWLHEIEETSYRVLDVSQ